MAPEQIHASIPSASGSVNTGTQSVQRLKGLMESVNLDNFYLYSNRISLSSEIHKYFRWKQ